MSITTYSLIVDIDSNQYPLLKSGGYKLCIAKKVNGVYNTIWSGADFLQSNHFEWVENYQLFVSAATSDDNLTLGQAQDIKFGQTCVFSKLGVLGPATGTPDDSGNFYFENDYGFIHAGVNEPLNGTFTPVYLSPTLVPGTVQLTPVKSVLVWFDTNPSTGMPISRAVSNSIEVTYNEATDHAISYQGKTLGIWVYEYLDGVAMAMPVRGYSSAIGFYEDSHVDPYTFLRQARCCMGPRAIDSVASQSDLECTVEFPTTSVANDSRAYLKQKIIPNICQVIPDQVHDLTFTVKLKLASVMFMKEMMKGETDEEKIVNTFNSELDGLAIPPTARKFSHGASIPVENACVILSLGTHIALKRDTDSETAVVGSNIVKVVPHVEWKFISASEDLYYIAGIHSHETFLSVHGHPERGSCVIHSSTKTTWAINNDAGGIRIFVPGTKLHVELGPKHEDFYNIILGETCPGEKQIWKVIVRPPNN